LSRKKTVIACAVCRWFFVAPFRYLSASILFTLFTTIMPFMSQVFKWQGFNHEAADFDAGKALSVIALNEMNLHAKPKPPCRWSDKAAV